MPRSPVKLPKITRPRVGYAHPRERLYDRLHASRSPVVWISAPGGSGKTTLAASYTAAFKLRTLWYQVDAGDGDPASFFHYLGLAVKTAAPRSSLHLPHLTPEYALGLPVYSRRFFEQLWRRLGTSSVLVFDSFQDLPLRAPVHQWLADAMAGIPEGCRVIVLSRDDHPPEFTRLRAGAAMDCLGWTDLRLSDEEALGIAQKLYGRPEDTFPRERVDQLIRRSGGWAAGLVLMIEANRASMNEQLDSDPSRELLFDYFASQLFDGAAPEVKQLLLTSALLPTMSASTLCTLTGDARAGRRLAELFQRNYFITCIGNAPATYEYHSLFREFLLQRAEEAWAPEQLTQLRRQAARALLDTGQSAPAVDLLLVTGAWPEAVAEITRLAPELVTQGRFPVLQAWLDKLPEPVTSANPWLQYWQAICLMGPDPVRADQCFESAYQKFQGDQDIAGLYLTFADGIQLAWISEFDFRRMDAWLDRMEQISAAYPDVPSVEIEARVLASLLMGLYFRRLGDEHIPVWLDRARHVLDHPLHSLLRSALLSSLGWHYYGRGDFRSWLQRLNSLTEHGEPDASPLSQLHLLVSAGLGRIHGGEFSAALQAVEQGLRLAEESGVHVLDIMLLGVRIEAALFLQDLAAADAALREINKILTRRPHGFYNSFACYLRSWRALLANDLPQAVSLGQESVALAEASGCAYPIAACRHALAHALLQTGRTEEGQRMLQQSRLRWNGGEHQHQAFQCELTEAWQCLQQGEQERAKEFLRLGLQRGETMGYGAPAMARPAFLYPLLDLALREGIHVEFVQRIIRQLRLVPPQPADVPSAWPVPLRIRTLGPFEVMIDGTPLNGWDLQRNRPLELLKALIALGGSHVAQEHLAESLWPDAAGDRAIATLHTTLHRLRKLLRWENAVVLRDGHLSLNHHAVWVDTWAVSALLDRLESALAGGECDTRQLAALQRELQSLCLGRFLEFEPERAWALGMADKLDQRVARACLRLGQQWHETGVYERAVEAYQTALLFDPLAEELHRRLMRLHADHGNFAEALLVYERCRKVLSLRLNVSPGRATNSLYHSIRERLTQP